MNYNILEIKEQMQTLISKWKNKVPDKDDPKWWRWRVDKSKYTRLESRLKQLQKNAPPKQIPIT